MLNTIIDDTKKRMEKSLDGFRQELHKIRTGRAHPSLLDGIKVSYYGTDTPLSQVAAISVSDSRTLLISPWEKGIIPSIEKAILGSGLGLNPVTSGDTTRIPLPPLNEERRRELIKLVKNSAEQARVGLRNIRRDANTELKESLKKKLLSEDDERRQQEQIQKITDKYIEEIDKILAHKETELMEI